MPYYKIMSASTGKYLSVEGGNYNTLANTKSVLLDTYKGYDTQRWGISSLGTNMTVRSQANFHFGLNSDHATSPIGCNVFMVIGNDTTGKVNFIVQGNYVKICLTNYTMYYLTASSSGTDVYWTTATNAANQLWLLTDVTNDARITPLVPTANMLPMSLLNNLNMFYDWVEGEDDKYEWIRKEGCATCCAAMVASYYDNYNYTPYDFVDAGIAVEGVGVIWSQVPRVSFTDYTGSDYRSKIKSELDAGRPVLIHCKLTTDDIPQHWVVAFEYENSASTDEKIYVFDPSGDKESPGRYGEVRTLTDSMRYNELDYVNLIKLTNVKL